MRVVKSEKRSWMALWQLRRVPRRITQAPHTADCQQGHREAPWMEIHNHTHTNMHRDTQTYCSRCLPCRILMSVSPVSCPPSFTKFYSSSLFLFLSFHFSPLILRLLFSHSPSISITLSTASPKQQGEERLGLACTRQVTYAASSGCLSSSFCFAVKYQGGETPPPSTLLTHSIFWPFISLYPHKESHILQCVLLGLSLFVTPTYSLLSCSNTSDSGKSQFIWQNLKCFHIVLEFCFYEQNTKAKRIIIKPHLPSCRFLHRWAQIYIQFFTHRILSTPYIRFN